MRITVKSGILAAAIWITIKWSLFLLGFKFNDILPMVLLNIFCLLAAISIGLYLQKRRDTEETNTLVDMKNAMSAGLPYVLLVSLFIYIYYSKINPEFYEHQIAEREVEIEKLVNDPVALKNFQKDFPDAEVMTKEQIETKLKENNKKGASPGFTSTLATLSLLLLATLYSMMVTIIYRRVVFRN